MVRNRILVLICLMGLTNAIHAESIPSWVGSPPMDFEPDKSRVEKLLGAEYRTPESGVDLAAWLGDLPVPLIGDAALHDYYLKSWYEILINTRTPIDPSKDTLVYPSPSAVEPDVWDTPFIVMGLLEAGARAIDLARRQVLAFLPDDSRSENVPPGPLSMAVLEIYKKTGDWYFVQRCYRPLKANHERFIRNADRDRDKLYNWTPLYPRWKDSREGTENVAASVDLSSWAYLDKAALAEMAAILALDSDARRWQFSADDLAGSIRNRMWNSSTGTFCDLGSLGVQIEVPTASGMMPLFFGIASKEQAERMIPVLADMEALGKSPRGNSSKPGEGSGGLRPEIAWLAIRGLRKYEAYQTAERFSRNVVKMVMKEPTSRESYNPRTHKGSGAEYSAAAAASFIRICNDEIRYETGLNLGIAMTEYATTIVPPEDAVVSVTVTNPGGEPLSDLVVTFHSEFPVEGSVRKKSTLDAGASLAFAFRAKVPEDARGLSYFGVEATAKSGDRLVVSQTGRTYAMRDHLGVELQPPNHGMITSDSAIAVPGNAVNYRVEPISKGTVVLTMPEGWKVIPQDPQKTNFPFGVTLSKLQFSVQPPPSLPVGEYPLIAEVAYRDHRGQKAQKMEAGKLWKGLNWAVAGPFDTPGEGAFESQYPPEKGVDLKASTPGKSGERFWRGLPLEWVTGFASMNLPTDGSATKNRLAYLYTTIISRTSMNVQVKAECDGPFALWINGIELARQPKGPNTYSIPANLNEGLNHVLIKTCPGDPKWGVTFVLVDGAGKPVTGLECDLSGLSE